MGVGNKSIVIWTGNWIDPKSRCYKMLIFPASSEFCKYEMSCAL